MLIGLINEEKIPADSRVAFTPTQCAFLMKEFPAVKIVAEKSDHRCFSNAEYSRAGVELVEALDDCDVIFGIKEIPEGKLIANKIYFFFSHTKKMQPYNQKMLQAILQKKITLIDYECLEHEDGARVLGFGFFAGVVGAHNGMMAFGKKTGEYELARVHLTKSFNRLIHTYFGLKLPVIKIAVTGSGRVAHGVLEIMNLMGIHEVEPDQFLEDVFTYPVYVQLKGADLYKRKNGEAYSRKHFHESPQEYISDFQKYLPHTDILMNGIYWDEFIPRLFEMEDMKDANFKLTTISDITDDMHGSVPCNLGDSTIVDPVYGVNKISGEKTLPYINGSIDIMAVGNLPNELPRDASKYFGEQMIKYIIPDLLNEGENNKMLERATMVKKGILTDEYAYLKDYAQGK